MASLARWLEHGLSLEAQPLLPALPPPGVGEPSLSVCDFRVNLSALIKY